jgi:hypothetical protein
MSSSPPTSIAEGRTALAALVEMLLDADLAVSDTRRDVDAAIEAHLVALRERDRITERLAGAIARFTPLRGERDHDHEHHHI